jgi:anti-sigma B factor antagonist
MPPSPLYERLSRKPIPLPFHHIPKRESLMPDQPAPRRLALEIEQCNDNLTIVRCQGQLVSGLTDVLYSNVRPMIQANKRIVLDLSELTWMDSMGLGALVSLYTSAKASGCELQLLKIGKRVRELLGLTHLLDVFSIIGEHGVRL